MRIWFDLDSVIYNLHDPWLKQHNAEYPAHDLKIEDHKGWDASKACKDNNCAANIYSYFDNPETWLNGKPIEGSIEAINTLLDSGEFEIGIITTTPNALAAKCKLEWLAKYLPRIKDIIIVTTHLKHLVEGDILVDDGLHNLEHFNGVRILYDMPWNRDSDKYIRAKNWDEVMTAIIVTSITRTIGISNSDIEQQLKISIGS